MVFLLYWQYALYLQIHMGFSCEYRFSHQKIIALQVTKVKMHFFSAFFCVLASNFHWLTYTLPTIQRIFNQNYHIHRAWTLPLRSFQLTQFSKEYLVITGHISTPRTIKQWIQNKPKTQHIVTSTYSTFLLYFQSLNFDQLSNAT